MIYWPVGTGDSTTLVVIPGEVIVQIDLHHLEKAESREEPEWPVIDRLVEVLPVKNGRPYLSLFVLTHPDQDHVRGFAELLRRVDIGEIWHTPRIFRARSDQEALCEDAKAFRREVHRRREVILKNPGNVRSKDLLRVIGRDDILNDDKYKGIPDAFKSRPGDRVITIDGTNVAVHFHAFIHAPFAADQDLDKNNTSLALNIALWEGKQCGQFFFFGDREYATIKRIFEVTEAGKENAGYLYWDVMLAAHHCSKAVMYWQGPGETDETFRKDIMGYFARYARPATGYIVSSSHSDFTDGTGDNPPHKKARDRYEKIVKPGRFICTHEYPSKQNPEPLIFLLTPEGVRMEDKRPSLTGAATLAGTVAAARGETQPPSGQTTFGAPR